MPESAHTYPSTSRGWRGQGAAVSSRPASRLAHRLFFTTLGLGLAAILAWVLIRWWFLPNVHFVALPIVDYDVLAVPPIPYIQEDLDGFTATSPSGSAVVLRELQTSESILTLVNRLQGITTRPRDTLVLYVSAHGVSDNGIAYLLCSDYLHASGRGRYPVRDFLEQVRQSKAALKVVLLDPGPLRTDPPQGMVVNEFSRLLEDEVAKVNDPDLWVFAANGPLEVSHSIPSAVRSAFGEFVRTGLEGMADGDGDGVIALDEFATFVQSNVSRWVNLQTEGKQSQTPCILQGGVGASQPSPKMKLVPTPRPKVASESEAVASPADAATGPAEQSRPEPRLQRLLQEAWTLCDTTQQRPGDGGWTPVDYAPHLWREYQQLLLGYDLRSRSGAAYARDELAREIETNILPLKSVMAGSGFTPSAGSSTVLARLTAARQRFVDGDVPRSYRELPVEFATLQKAVQLKNDLLYRATDYVRWHAAASSSSPRPLPLLEPLSELLTQRLPEFIELLDSWEQSETSADLQMRDAPVKLKELEGKMQALEALRAKIEKDGLEQEVRELIQGRGKPENSGRISALLNTSLLPAESRSRLLDALSRPGAFVSPSAVFERQDRLPAAPSWRWDRLSEQASLEVALVALHDPQSRSALRSPSLGGDATEAWLQYRQLGGQLGALYQGLPGRIDALAAAGSPGDLREAERLLRLLDARNAAQIALPSVRWTVRPAPKILPPASTLQLAGPEKLELRPETWTDLELSLRTAGTMEGVQKVRLQYDPAFVEIADAATMAPVLSERESEVPSKSGVATLRYKIRPRIATARSTSLAIAARGGGQSAARTIEMSITPPDFVEFMVRGPRGASYSSGRDSQHLRLRPFPNRVTDYRFELVNHSGRKRKVQVQIFGMEQPLGERGGPRQSPLDTLGNPRPGVQKICELPLELPAEATAIPIVVPPPAPPSKEAKPEAKEPKEPKEPPPVPVTSGVVCMVRDVEQPQREWVHWLDFVPLAPKDYLDVNVSYDAARQQIEIQVEPRDTDGDGRPNPEILPPLSPEESIEIVWDTAGSLPPDTEMNNRAAISPPNYRARLFAHAPPRPDKIVWVWLTVDGYPRAFVYQVHCDRDRQSIERERSLARVQITAPQPGKAFRSPLERLPVEFQVDAPEDAFQQSGDSIQIWIDDDGSRRSAGRPSRQFFADRQVDVLLQKIDPQGTVKIDAQVHDFKTELMPGGLQNKRVDVVGRLLLAGRGPLSDRPVEDAVPVVLDGSPPRLRVDPVASPVALGGPLNVAGQVEDLGGADKIEVGFDLDGSGDLEEKEVLKKLQQFSGATAAWKSSLATKELEQGRYRILVRATDRVGLVSRQSQIVVLVAPPPKQAMEAKPVKHAIAGLVLVGDRPCSNFEVRLEGAGQVATTDLDGKFSFKDLPPGKYTLKASGAALNRFRKGTAEITLPAAQEPASVTISVE